jgi:hypothetical protein
MNNTLQVDESKSGVRGTCLCECRLRSPVSTKAKAASPAYSQPAAIARFMDAFRKRRRHYTAYVILTFLAIGLTALLMPSSSGYFRHYFGETNPLLVVVLASISGGISLSLLHALGTFEIFSGRTTLRGIGVSAGLASVLAVAIIIADFFIRYPEDTNVPLPEALLFYPAVGFVAEIAFHVLPLALLMLVLSPLRRKRGSDRRIRPVWLAIAIAAVAEPTFQVVLPGDGFSLASAYTWLHVFAIASLQLYVFKRYDFISMYSFRLIYYAYWHVAWGVIRLEVLF